MADTDTLLTGQSKAGDWRSYERVILPPIKDLHQIDVYEQNGGYQALKAVVKDGKFDPTGLTNEVKASGLRGRGGAGFGTGLKWSFMPPVDPEKPRYLCCNGDESEPGTFKDRQIFEYNPHLMIEGIVLACYAMSIKTCYLYIRGEYIEYVEHVQKAVDEAYAKGYIGQNILGTDFSTDLVVHYGAGAYICGEETALFNSIEGYRGEPRNKPPFPTTHGLFDEPTVVNNVETLANVPRIVLNGGGAFADEGTEGSSGTRLFCVSGRVATPGLYEFEFGVTLGEVLEAAGGFFGTGSLAAVLLGGAAGSFVGPDSIDLPLTFEATREAGVSLGSGVVMAFGDHDDLADTVRRIAAFFRDESCGQCVPCRVGTVRQEELLIRLSDGTSSGDERPLFDDLAAVMGDASICGLGHTASSAVRSALDLGLLVANR